MKRSLAIMVAAMLLLCSSLATFAEDTNSNTNHPSQMGGEAPEGVVLTVDGTDYTGCVLTADSLPAE